MHSQSDCPGRVAGIDYGTVRIGIALSDPGRSIASPMETYVRRNPELDAAALSTIGQTGGGHAVRRWLAGVS